MRISLSTLSASFLGGWGASRVSRSFFGLWLQNWGDIIWPLTTFGLRCNVDYHESFVLHFAQFSGMESFSISILEMEIWNRVFYRSTWMEETMKWRMAGLLELDPKARFSTSFLLLWHVVLLNVINYKKEDDTKSGSGSHSAAPDQPVFLRYNVF